MKTMKTTRRSVLAGAAVLPFAAVPTVALPAVEPDAELFAKLARIRDLRARADSAYAIAWEIGTRINAANGHAVETAAAAAREYMARPASEVDIDVLNGKLDAFRAAGAARELHPDYPAEQAADERYAELIDEVDPIEEEFRRMPAATPGGVLEKLRNLASDCCWESNVEGWAREPIEQAIADLEQIVGGRAGA